MNDELVGTISRIIKQAVLGHPNTLFGQNAFQIMVRDGIEALINQTVTNFVAQGIICNLDCSGNPKQAVYCLATEHGGNEAANRQFFEEIVRITRRP